MKRNLFFGICFIAVLFVCQISIETVLHKDIATKVEKKQQTVTQQWIGVLEPAKNYLPASHSLSTLDLLVDEVMQTTVGNRTTLIRTGLLSRDPTLAF